MARHRRPASAAEPAHARRRWPARARRGRVAAAGRRAVLARRLAPAPAPTQPDRRRDVVSAEARAITDEYQAALRQFDGAPMPAQVRSRASPRSTAASRRSSSAIVADPDSVFLLEQLRRTYNPRLRADPARRHRLAAHRNIRSFQEKSHVHPHSAAPSRLLAVAPAFAATPINQTPAAQRRRPGPHREHQGPHRRAHLGQAAGAESPAAWARASRSWRSPATRARSTSRSSIRTAAAAGTCGAATTTAPSRPILEVMLPAARLGRRRLGQRRRRRAAGGRAQARRVRVSGDVVVTASSPGEAELRERQRRHHLAHHQRQGRGARASAATCSLPAGSPATSSMESVSGNIELGAKALEPAERQHRVRRRHPARRPAARAAASRPRR